MLRSRLAAARRDVRVFRTDVVSIPEDLKKENAADGLMFGFLTPVRRTKL